MLLQILPTAPTHPLSPVTISALTVLALLIVGFFVEKHYISRLTVFSNSVALITFLNSAQQLDWILIAYGGAGGIAGLIGMIYYIRQRELWVEYYEITFFTYSSAPIGLFIVLSLFFTTHWIWLLPALFLGAGINSKLLLLLEDKTVPINELPLAIPIAQWFLDTYVQIRRSM